MKEMELKDLGSGIQTQRLGLKKFLFQTVKMKVNKIKINIAHPKMATFCAVNPYFSKKIARIVWKYKKNY